MKRQERVPRARSVSAVLILVLAMSPGLIEAADNQGIGDIAGTAADLNDSNVFTLTTTTLGLVKTAFLADGTPLTSGDSVPKGTLVKFMIYVDNTTAVAVNDVNVQDVLDVAFTYQTGTIKVDNSVNTGGTAAAIYAAVDAATALDDGVDLTDVAGISGTTVSAGSGTGNVQVNVAASKVWAILFTVQM